MNPLLDHFVKQQLLYENEYPITVDKLKNEEMQFLLHDKFFTPNLNLNPDISKLERAYHKFHFFTNDDIIKKLKKEFGNKKNVFKWFIPIESLNNEFKNLNNAGIIIDKPQAVYLVRQHLTIKFLIDFVRVFMSKNTKDPYLLIIEVLNALKKRIIYRENSQRGSISDEDIKLINHLSRNLDDVDTLQIIKLHKRSVSGDTTIAMKGIFENCFYYENIGKNELFRSLFGFCKLIFSDDTFLTEDEFDDEKDKYLGKSYKVYQAYKVNKVLAKYKIEWCFPFRQNLVQDE